MGELSEQVNLSQPRPGSARLPVVSPSIAHPGATKPPASSLMPTTHFTVRESFHLTHSSHRASLNLGSAAHSRQRPPTPHCSPLAPSRQDVQGKPVRFPRQSKARHRQGKGIITISSCSAEPDLTAD